MVSSQQVFVAELNTGCSLCGERKRSETGNNGWQEVRTTDYGIPAPRRD